MDATAKTATKQRRAPQSPPRIGPRPLALHLTIAWMLFASSRAAWPISNLGWLPWNRDLADEAESLRRALDGVAPAAFAAAVDRASRHELDRFLAGIEAYHAHRYRRPLADPPELWRDGSTRLLDYGTGQGGQVVLFIPSLINRAYILDLHADRSLLRTLAGAGLRPLLLDWGAPGEEERDLDLTGYIKGRGGAALACAAEISGGPVAVAGYCMGGLLALALAQLRPDAVERLALLATPWDFSADAPASIATLKAFHASVEAILDTLGVLPVDLVQAMFASLDPFLVYRKFVRFADMKGKDAERFVALEDWLNDGVALAGPVARECLFGWYGDNTPGCGAWRVAGQRIVPADIDIASLVVVPGHDRIVPPPSAFALAEALPRAETMVPATGHIGMIAGGKARVQVWDRLAAWLGGTV